MKVEGNDKGEERWERRWRRRWKPRGRWRRAREKREAELEVEGRGAIMRCVLNPTGASAWSSKWPANPVYFFHHQIEIKIICNHFSASLLFLTKPSKSALANTLRQVVRVLDWAYPSNPCQGLVYFFLFVT